MAQPKRRMIRQEWYLAYMLCVLSGASFFDGHRISGGILLGFSVLIVVLCDGFGVRL